MKCTGDGVVTAVADAGGRNGKKNTCRNVSYGRRRDRDVKIFDAAASLRRAGTRNTEKRRT